MKRVRPAPTLGLRTQKSPRGAGWFGMIGASTESACNTSAGDFRNQVFEEPVMQRIYSGTRSRVCHPSVQSSPYPDPSAVRAFVRFIGELQHANGGQPVILHPPEIARATGITEADQIGIRQTLMLAGRLRLSVVGNAWAYRLEVQS
jgi:hypothetical protein